MNSCIYVFVNTTYGTCYVAYMNALPAASSMWRLFEAGRLLTFPTYRVGAYSRWPRIRGWPLNRINTVFPFGELFSGKRVMGFALR